MKRDTKITPVPLNELLDEWIKIMKRVIKNQYRFDITAWQRNEKGYSLIPGEVKKTETAIHKCGFAACGGGYLAASRYWKKIGGTMDFDGAPEVGCHSGSEALFNIVVNGDKAVVREGMRGLVQGSRHVFDLPMTSGIDQITAQQFLDALVRFRETGSPNLPREEDQVL